MSEKKRKNLHSLEGHEETCKNHLSVVRLLSTGHTNNSNFSFFNLLMLLGFFSV